jgi:hypothetical protein
MNGQRLIRRGIGAPTCPVRKSTERAAFVSGHEFKQLAEKVDLGRKTERRGYEARLILRRLQHELNTLRKNLLTPSRCRASGTTVEAPALTACGKTRQL